MPAVSKTAGKLSIYQQQTFIVDWEVCRWQTLGMLDTNHPLAKWIDERDLSRDDFATAVGISGSHLSLVLRGRRKLSLDAALRIETYTGQEFTAARLQKEHELLNEASGVS